MKKSVFMSLGKIDLIKSAIMAGGSVIAMALIVVLQGITATPPVYPSVHELIGIFTSGLVAAGVYLLKNLFTNSKDEFGKKETTDAPAQ